MSMARQHTMNSRTEALLLRFDILEPSGFSNMGRCANRGGFSARQEYRSRCNGRDGSHS